MDDLERLAGLLEQELADAQTYIIQQLHVYTRCALANEEQHRALMALIKDCIHRSIAELVLANWKHIESLRRYNGLHPSKFVDPELDVGSWDPHWKPPSPTKHDDPGAE